ncbi:MULTISPECIES: hypothetical protein [Streptomyces]|uniref:hypothetical protein n=1 Tax=Streptomyces TaxID=1883 RepID=UPI002034C6CC|nr:MULTISPECIES: hypothetical protein [Streptomyces]
MTPSAELSGLPLPAFGRPAPEDVAHPALAAVLAELREREASGEPVVAYYEDAP